MQTFISEPAVINVQNFVSGYGNIVPRTFSNESEFAIRRFEASAETKRQIQIPGGYLTWTVRKDSKDSVHASRVHGSLYGSVPPFHPWEDTKINKESSSDIIEGSTDIISPFYESPSAYVSKEEPLKIAAISHGLSIFSQSESQEGFVENVHEIASRNSPVRVKISQQPTGETSAGYLLNSGNIYYEAGIAEVS